MYIFQCTYICMLARINGKQGSIGTASAPKSKETRNEISVGKLINPQLCLITAIIGIGLDLYIIYYHNLYPCFLAFVDPINPEEIISPQKLPVKSHQ